MVQVSEMRLCERGCRLLFALLLALAFAPLVHAQQVPSDPTSSHIFPAGGQRGAKLAVRVGGECLPPLTRFRIFGEGVTAPEILGAKAVSRGEPSPRRRPGEVHIYYPKEWEHNLEIAADAPLGVCLWRLSCARGGTGARPFIVGDLPEFIETESNSTLQRAEAVTLPVTINGQIEGERDLDYFQFDAREGEVVTVDVVSRRLGSPLEPVAEFYNHDGQRVSAQLLYRGSDPMLAMRAPATGRYSLMLAHLGFQGGPQYVYRATLSTEPQAAFVYPAGGQRGTVCRFEAYALTGLEKLRALPFETTLSSDLHGSHILRGGLPGPSSVSIEASESSNQLEQETNDTVATAEPIKGGCDVHGRFLTSNDEDWFRFDATKDSLWTIECRRFPDGSDCLPILSVTNQDGAQLASASAADDPRQPCRLNWRAPAAGTYFVRLRDVQQGIRGGPDFIYRLLVRPAVDSFELSLPTDVVNVVQGARAEIELKVRRTGDFSGAIDLELAGLPEGVRFEPKQIAAGQDSIKLALVAEDNARPCDSKFTIRGRATHKDVSLSAIASALHLGHDSENVSVGSPTVDHLQLTLRHKPVLRLYCSEAYQYAYRGTVYPYAMQLERLNGFTGPVHIEIADRQIKDLDGIVVQETEIPAGQTQFMLPIYLPETMHINVQAHSNVYAQAYAIYEDEWGQPQSQLFVSEMRCMIRPLPTVVKLSAVDGEVPARPGQPLTCRLRLERTTNFAGPMQIELAEPASAAGCLAKPITIAANESTATVELERVPPEVSQLKFRATGQLAGYHSVISETTIRVQHVAP